MTNAYAGAYKKVLRGGLGECIEKKMVLNKINNFLFRPLLFPNNMVDLVSNNSIDPSKYRYQNLISIEFNLMTLFQYQIKNQNDIEVKIRFDD